MRCYETLTILQCTERANPDSVEAINLANSLSLCFSFQSNLPHKLNLLNVSNARSASIHGFQDVWRGRSIHENLGRSTSRLLWIRFWVKLLRWWWRQWHWWQWWGWIIMASYILIQVSSLSTQRSTCVGSITCFKMKTENDTITIRTSFQGRKKSIKRPTIRI